MFSGSEVSSSVHTFLPDLNTCHDHVTGHLADHVTSPPAVYVWLQYAVPKVGKC